MKTGRKKEPKALQLAKGNPGKRPMNDEEPVPKFEMPKCPDFLDETAREEWFWISQELFEMGVLALTDKTALAMYCQSFSRWAQAEEFLQREGFIVEGERGTKINPYISIAQRAMADCRALLSDFGLTPSSRANLKVGKEKGALDPFAAYQERKKQRA
jgi:P27 family predicted phage terminase small subunit